MLLSLMKLTRLGAIGVTFHCIVHLAFPFARLPVCPSARLPGILPRDPLAPSTPSGVQPDERRQHADGDTAHQTERAGQQTVRATLLLKQR
ncbi:hypothetical protein PAN31108_03510 [Pandoraea anhela]|uniref:Uncharacterized protein n=1 Tax=Pandoraea anhela TaxID=2508295 RepID=A0A5E4WZ38_9BURK|nr:hypothetical protein PAN31108_03510 [Pandoraea anhela]